MIFLDSLKPLPLIHAVTTREQGNIGPKYGSAQQVALNLQAICHQLHLSPNSVIRPQQVHQAQVAIVDSSQSGQTIPQADGLITADPQVTLLLGLGDCVPVFLYDPSQQVIALLHSGWRGSIAKIVLVAIQQLMWHFHSHPSHLHLALGPSVQPASNLWDHPPFQTQLPEWAPFICKQHGKFQIDLPGFIVHTAVQAGVQPKNIYTSGIDTVTDPRLFSYRHHKNTGEPDGRFAAILKLNN